MILVIMFYQKIFQILELPNSYNIDYSEDKDYIILKISDSSWKQLFDLLFKLDADYVIN